MSTPKMWYGIEKEGHFAGMRTLFISSNEVSLYDIIENIKKYNIGQLYFGAGGCGNFDDVIVAYFLNNKNYDVITTVEIKNNNIISEVILDNAHIVLNLNSTTLDYLKPNDTIKIESPNQMLTIKKLNGKVLLKDNFLRQHYRYKGDKVIL